MSVSGVGETLSSMVFIRVLYIGIATLVRITQKESHSLCNKESMRLQNSEPFMLVLVHTEGAKCVGIKMCSNLHNHMQILRAT